VTAPGVVVVTVTVVVEVAVAGRNSHGYCDRKHLLPVSPIGSGSRAEALRLSSASPPPLYLVAAERPRGRRRNPAGLPGQEQAIKTKGKGGGGGTILGRERGERSRVQVQGGAEGRRRGRGGGGGGNGTIFLPPDALSALRFAAGASPAPAPARPGAKAPMFERLEVRWTAERCAVCNSDEDSEANKFLICSRWDASFVPSPSPLFTSSFSLPLQQGWIYRSPRVQVRHWGA